MKQAENEMLTLVGRGKPAGEFLQSCGGEVLLLAGSRGAADDLARRCAQFGVLGLHRMTLNQLAAALATPGLVAEGKAPASRLSVEAIAARIVHLLRKEGRIPYFAPVSATPASGGYEVQPDLAAPPGTKKLNIMMMQLMKKHQ